jgi:hypothetical protein
MQVVVERCAHNKTLLKSPTKSLRKYDTSHTGVAGRCQGSTHTLSSSAQTYAPARRHSSVLLSSMPGPYPSTAEPRSSIFRSRAGRQRMSISRPLVTPVGHPCRISESSPIQQTRAAGASLRMANCSPPDAISVPLASACASLVRPTAAPMILTSPSSSRWMLSAQWPQPRLR